MRDQKGFSLVETLAALLVFGIITLGLIPLLAGSIRGSDISRKATAGKQIVTEAMERARGLPFYIDYNTQARKVDVLDLYFPGRTAAFPTFSASTCTGYLNTGTVTCTATGYQATGPAYITTCPDATNIACPQDLPADYSLTFEASFVSAVVTTTPETYVKATPLSTYTYNSSGNDLYTKPMIQLVATARWTQTGRGPRTYSTRTLISDRRFSGLKLLGEATTDYAVQFITGYSNVGQSAQDSELTITTGYSTSRIESRRTAQAATDMRAAEAGLIDLVAVENDISTDDYMAGGGPFSGAASTQVAPPDASANPGQVLRVDVEHPSGPYDEVGGFDITDGDSAEAAVTSALPTSNSDFDFSNSSAEDVWVNNARSENDLQLDDSNAQWENNGIARVITKSATAMSGGTDATSYGIGTQPSVVTSSTISFKELQLFPVDEIYDEDPTFGGAVVAVTGPVVGGVPTGSFSATATCNANNDGTAAGASANATYSGALWYWRDPDPTDDIMSNGSYVSVSLADTGTDPLAALESGAPIAVYDENNDNKDVYLFDDGTHPFYLETWASLATPTESVTNNGRTIEAKLDKSLSIETAPVEGSAQPHTALAISVGSVSCRAEDNR